MLRQPEGTAMARRRRQYSAAFKAQVALAAIGGTMTAAQLAGQFGIHRNLVIQWRSHLVAHAADAFHVQRHPHVLTLWPMVEGSELRSPAAAIAEPDSHRVASDAT